MKIFLDANICLDLLDTTRKTSKASVEWYLQHKDREDLEFYFSSDFITTFFYILTQKKKQKPQDVITAIEMLSQEVMPLYFVHEDFINAKSDFQRGLLEDFEDLFVLSSAQRIACEIFLTNDKELLKLGNHNKMRIVTPADMNRKPKIDISDICV